MVSDEVGRSAAIADQIRRSNPSLWTFMRPSCPRLATHYETLAVPQNATKAQIKAGE